MCVNRRQIYGSTYHKSKSRTPTNFAFCCHAVINNNNGMLSMTAHSVGRLRCHCRYSRINHSMKNAIWGSCRKAKCSSQPSRCEASRWIRKASIFQTPIPLFQKPFVYPKAKHLFPTVSDNSMRSRRLTLIESSL